jgi:hypothetical protein
MTVPDRAVGAQPWDTEWQPSEPPRLYATSGATIPECLENPRVLDEHETAAHEAALLGDREGYREALRGHMKAGRNAALEIRKGAA